ncbi:cupin domain-containing protein [Anabaena sp. PCC 7108]|uniref:cupin domain-containing protein n=1 Tax=Anabaena sp. PCC 7108 TaxID=163908 RepID=UPI00034B7A76|nr:cupin domain-containing protein [Anabaena sp. PCC 7108]
MQVYQNTGNRWFCGHWNKSPIEVGYCHYFQEVPAGEVYHSHQDFCEYYVVLQGYGTIKIEDTTFALEPNTVMMIEPNERHRILSVDSEEALIFVVVKSKSVPNNKVLHKEEDAKFLQIQTV